MRWTDCGVLGLAITLAGCAGPQAERALRTDGPRMVELFRGAAPAAAAAAPEAPARAHDCAPLRRVFGRRREASVEPPAVAEVDVGGAYTRTALNELQLLFPRLPNPDIVIYVFPHLATAQRVPVPGYTTAVPLYERVEYALPGEVEVVE